MPLQPKKTNRDYPLAPTSEPITLRDELIKRNVSGTSQKLMEENKNKEKNDSIANKTMNEIRYKKIKEDMQNMTKQSFKTGR